MNKVEKQILILLAMAQFILTLDSTVMNVSISTLVTDLHTTVTGVQSAITFYTLVMAAFMIPGAKIGDIIGRKKAFVIGLIIYGIGSFITAISPNLPILMFGWSLLEGLGAALVIPAMLSLIASNYPAGPKRVKAYSMVAAIAAIGAAVGPIIGGFLTTYLTWRLAFFSEVLVVIYILLKRKLIKDSKSLGKSPKLDIVGIIFSASGLALLVFGILQASTYGLIKTRKDWIVNGNTIISAGGISPTVIFCTIGLVLMVLFVFWEYHRTIKQKSTLIKLQLLKNKIVTAGMGSIFFQLFLLGGVMYGVSIFLQLDLGYSAILTGLSLIPLSIMILVLASRGTIMSNKFSSKFIVRAGFLLMLAGSIWLGIKSGDTNVSGWTLAPSLALFGAGMGMMASQLQNVVQNSVTEQDSGEASGLMATFQYLGQSFGVAVIGVLIVATLISSSSKLIANSSLTSSQQIQLNTAYEQDAQIASNAQVEAATANLPPEESSEVVQINAEARQTALSHSFILLAVISVFGLISAKNIPDVRPKRLAKTR